jgi:hypothetical protein
VIGDTYLFQVAKHKTAESGPAVLAVNPKLYGYLRLYLDMLRGYILALIGYILGLIGYMFALIGYIRALIGYMRTDVSI